MNGLTFCGDVWLPAGSDVEFPDELTEGLVINLEAPITTPNPMHATPGKICLATDCYSLVKTFKKLPLAVCLANNHILDYGKASFENTISELKRLGILYFGAGSLIEHANNPLIVDLGKNRVALMGYVCASTHPIWAESDSPGVVPIDLDIIQSDVARAKQLGASKIILMLHWGEEEVSLPKPSDVELSKKLLKLGVDLIIGHHAHCRQPIYVGKSGPAVFYGLGNALFPDFDYKANNMTAWSKQRKWNKNSTAVKVTADWKVTWVGMEDMRTKENKLRIVRGTKLTWTKLPDIADYHAVYHRAWRFGMFRLYLSRMIARPHFPSPRAVFKLVKASVFGGAT